MSVEQELKELKIEHEKLRQDYKDVLNIALFYQEQVKKLQGHNLRGAGRHKQDFTEEIKKIKSYRGEGKTVKEIAKLLKCSERRIYRLLSL